MKKTISKLTTMGAILAALFSTAASSQAFAATNIIFVDDVTTIPLTRTITGVSNPVTNTFTYTVTPNADNPSGASGIPTSASIAFSSASPDSSHSVTSTGALDFSNATFTTAGDYYYTVTETGSTDSSNFPLDSTTYTAIASVRYAVNDGVVDPDTLLVTLLQDMQKTGGGKEPAVWQSEAPRTYFEILAQTTGNMADLAHCFVYTINIPTGSGIYSGDTFSVSTASECTNPSTITAGQNTTVRLKHNDILQVGGTSSTISQLPVGSGYNITLTDAEGYTATFNGSTMTAGTPQSVTGLVAVDSPDFNTKNKANVTLTKNADVPTGAFTNVLVYLAIFGIGISGVVYATRRLHSRK